MGPGSSLLLYPVLSLQGLAAKAVLVVYRHWGLLPFPRKGPLPGDHHLCTGVQARDFHSQGGVGLRMEEAVNSQ